MNEIERGALSPPHHHCVLARMKIGNMQTLLNRVKCTAWFTDPRAVSSKVALGYERAT